MVVTVILTAVVIVLSVNTMWTYRTLLDTFEHQTVLEQSTIDLQTGSDYLTQQVRLYVMTGDREYAENFFYEAEVGCRRDHALEAIEPYVENEEVASLLSDALADSNELMEREYYAFRLVAEAEGTDPALLSESVASVVLDPEDAALSPEEKTELARELVFDDTYQAYKAAIRENTDRAAELIISGADASRVAITFRFRLILGFQIFFTLATLILILSFLTVIIRQVLKPLHHAAEQIRQKGQVDVSGSNEVRVLAAAYNEMFEQVAQDQVELSYEATHDALTGLYNRKVFDEIRTGDQKDYTLILADVDHFKQVNDTYGHDVGDQVLQKMAQVLLHNFRSEDYVCRIGGDEFAVIMLHTDSSLRQLVENKLASISSGMKDVSDGLPENSISAGIAFPDRENASEDIFIDADRALYAAKEAGRNGWRFF